MPEPLWYISTFLQIKGLKQVFIFITMILKWWLH